MIQEKNLIGTLQITKNKNQNEEQIYYIYNNKIFPTKTKKIKFIKEINDNSSDFQAKDLLIHNRLIINELKTDFFKTKEINISNNDLITHDNILKLKEHISQNNFKFKKNENSLNENFIEITSSEEIIKNINEKLNLIKTKFDQFKKKIQTYINENKNKEEELIEDYNAKIELLQTEIKKKKKTILLQNKQNKTLSKRINRIKQDIEKLQKKKTKLKNLTETNKNTIIKQKTELLNKKTNLETELIEIDFKIEETKNRIQMLKLDLKKGKNINITPTYLILFILTLGLIYWSNYSKIEQIILNQEQKIYKLKNKRLLLKKELEQTKKLLQELEEETKTETKKIKKQNLVKLKTDNLDKLLLEKENTQNELKKKLTLIDKDITQNNKELIKIKEKLNKILSKKEQYLKYSLKEIETILKKKEKQLEENITQIQKIKYFNFNCKLEKSKKTNISLKQIKKN